jgi:hypothetical protein
MQVKLKASCTSLILRLRPTLYQFIIRIVFRVRRRYGVMSVFIIPGSFIISSMIYPSPLRRGAHRMMCLIRTYICLQFLCSLSFFSRGAILNKTPWKISLLLICKKLLVVNLSFFELLRRLIRSNNSVYLLSESRKTLYLRTINTHLFVRRLFSFLDIRSIKIKKPSIIRCWMSYRCGLRSCLLKVIYTLSRLISLAGAPSSYLTWRPLLVFLQCLFPLSVLLFRFNYYSLTLGHVFRHVISLDFTAATA